MNNLVLGSSGFIGKPFCEYLRKLGEDVIEFDIKNKINSMDARYRELPILHSSRENRCYFLAWDVGGAKYLYNKNTQLEQLEWNIKLLSNVMPQLEGIKFIFVSSQLSENTDLSYGLTKKLGEKWTELLGGTTIRLWNIYGPYEEVSKRSHVIGDFIHQAITTKQIKMMTKGNEERQFIHIDDVNNALHYTIHCDTGKYDVTTNKWVSIREVAEIIASFNKSSIIEGEVEGNDSKIESKNLLPNWRPLISLEEGLRKTYDKFIERNL